MSSRKKACATCTLAKTKCVWKDGSRCERCWRLNKVCSESIDEEVLARKKPLKGAKALQTARAKSTKQAESGDHSSSSPGTLQSERLGSSPASNFNFAGPEKQELWLQLFRSHVTEHFPFVVVPDYVTSNDLLSEKPLLHNAIMMATCNHADEQVARALKLREDLARETLVEAKRNLDILQAILVACAYYHVHLEVNFQLTNMLAIGSAVLCDMLLNMSLQREDRRKTPFATQESPVFRMEHRERTLEERRIFLGFCYVTTMTFLTVHRVETIRNVQYLDQCCQILELTKQYPTDTYLVYLARVTKQAQIMVLSLDIEDQLPSFRPSIQDFSIMNSLAAEFEAFRMAQAQMGNLQTLHAQIHMLLVELYLRELGCMFDEAPAPVGSPMARDHPTARCYRVAMELFVAAPTMIAGPPSHWTYQEIWHFAHAMVVLLKCASDKRLRDQLALNKEDSLNSRLHDFELQLFELSKRHASAVSDSHNFYLRTTRQIRILRERYTAKKTVDDAMYEPQVSESTDHVYNSSNEPDTRPQMDFESWLGNAVEFGVGDMPAFYGMDMSFN